MPSLAVPPMSTFASRDMAKNSEFRPDIEFLRGIAVLIVIAFHLKIPYFSSGFIGVDIFFVISGYLMAQALKDSSPSTIGGFYIRRARRILPAAFFTFILFFIIACIFFLPFEVEKVAESFIGFIFLVPNIPFWLENSYFDEFSFRPMLHYWSLGIEIQYYLIFPILFFWFRRYLLWFLIASAVLSLIVTEISSKSAFFLLPTRIWEFLAGYYAFTLQSKLVSISESIKNRVSLISIAGLLLYTTIDIPQDKFPGFYAIPPVLLSFFVILFGISNKLIVNKLSPIRFMGKISYSAYLCHFPVIFLFIYAPFSNWKDFSGFDAVSAFVLTVGIATAMYYYIEEPFRKNSTLSNKNFIRLLCGITLLSLFSLLAMTQYKFYLKEYSSKEKEVFFAVNDQGTWRCHSIKSILDRENKACNMTNLSAPKAKILLIGDSHVDALKSIFLTQAKNYNTDVYLLKESCVLGIDNCTADKLVDLVKQANFTNIVLHGYLPRRFDFNQLEQFAAYAQKNNINIYFIDPIPTYKESVPKLLFDEIQAGKSSPLRYSRETYFTHMDSTYIQFRSKWQDYIRFYSVADILCPSECSLNGDDGIYYHDSHHLSLTGAKHLDPIAISILSTIKYD